MKNLKDILVEKLVISKTKERERTRIPNSIQNRDTNVFNRVFDTIKALTINAYPDSKVPDDAMDNEKLFNHCLELAKSELPKNLQTKEMIWIYINAVLGYDYMFDEEDDSYLNLDWEDVDPVEEFVYRAISDVIQQY